MRKKFTIKSLQNRKFSINFAASYRSKSRQRYEKKARFATVRHQKQANKNNLQ